MTDLRPSVALVAHAVHDGGGMERAFFELIRRSHREIRFVVISAELDEGLRPLVEWRRVRVPMRPFPLKLLLFAVLAGLRLRRARVDLVHTLGAIVPNRADIATVQFCNAGFRAATERLAPPSSPPLRRLNTATALWLGLLLERWCYRPGRLGQLAAVSRRVAAEVEHHYPGVRVCLTPNGVDPGRFRPDPAIRAEVRREHGVPAERLVALFVGGAWHHKGLAIAIEAAAQVRDDVELWIVGPGDAESFRALAERAGVRTVFLGRRADTERFFQAADIFLLPSLYETFSLGAHEAAASGLPVVATRVGAVEDLLEGGGAGIVVERSAAAFGTALAALAADPVRRRQLGETGRLRAAEIDWERSVTAVREAYDRLLEREAA